jgi:hypothetical protein
MIPSTHQNLDRTERSSHRQLGQEAGGGIIRTCHNQHIRLFPAVVPIAFERKVSPPTLH